MGTDTTQALFLRKIEDIIPASSSLVNELADLLELSIDSAYRRLRGETQLTLDEILTICNHFKISFDTFIDVSSNTVTFEYLEMNDKEDSFGNYLESLYKNLQIINGARQKQIVYACEDIPVFHNYKYPELAAFKIFYWMRSILNVPSLLNEKFNSDLVPVSLIEKGRQIVDLYAAIPSIEIWTDTTINSTIKQIEFYWEAGMFLSLENALKVCDNLRMQIDEIQKQAELGNKYRTEQNIHEFKNNYTVYFSEIELTNNCVLVNLGETKSVYLSHFTFNTMSTTNHSYCKETERWLNNIIKKATLISGVSEKLRYQFFRKAHLAIEKLEEKIKNG
ncbi:MAG: hypothetical protein JXB49_11200 [Bacteroidales bacterium]|nr:hypothetical protein [Bacteroidales bacterium]